MAGLILSALAISFIAALAFVPVVRAIALRVGMVDAPDRERKLHDRAIALGGGIGVFAAVVVAFIASLYLDRVDPVWELGTLGSRWYTLFSAVGAIMLVGLVDDAIALRGRQKLLFQCLIAAALVGSGTLITEIGFFGYEIELGVLAFPISVLWLLIAINALNLIDGADGMATTAGIVISCGMGFLGLQMGSPLAAIVGFSLAGGLAGFLVFNRPPATIFLGDSGSMMIGLFVGVLAVWTNLKHSTVLASAPVAILAIPLFDSTAAIMRRWLTGRSMYQTDRAHLHHLLQAKFGKVGMLFVVAALCSITTLLSLLSVSWNQHWLAGLGVFIVLALLVLTRSFGHAEFRLLLSRMRNFSHSFMMLPKQCDVEKHQRRSVLQGEGRWETIWEPMVEFARTHEISLLKIDLNLAWLHEGYNASWQSVRQPEKAFQLTVRLPLFAHRASDGCNVLIGRMDIIAPGNDPGVYDRIADLAAKLVDLGPQIELVVAEIEARHHHGVSPVAQHSPAGLGSRASSSAVLQEGGSPPRPSVDVVGVRESFTIDQGTSASSHI